MFFHALTLLIVLLGSEVAHAGLALPMKRGFPVPPAKYCLPSAHLKELSGCIAMTEKEDECGSKESREDKLDCYCTQEMFNAYIDCRSDVQRCLETHMFDGQFAMKVSRWHELCDPRISTTVTTPHTPTITTTYDMNACFRLEQSCRSADYETNKCSMTWMPSSSLSYVSCICQPPIYSLFSECQYNGNVSCKRTTADESNIMGYSVCSYFWSGSETLSSIDLTSFLSITGLGATQRPGIESQVVATATEPHDHNMGLTGAEQVPLQTLSAVDQELHNNELRWLKRALESWEHDEFS